MMEGGPAWLDEDPEALAWLGRVLDDLDAHPAQERKKPLRYAVGKHFPGLFRQGPDADARWELIKRLPHCGLPLTVVPDRKRHAFDPEYAGATLVLELSGEALIREWLARPRVTPEETAWREAVDGAEADWSAEARARVRERRMHIDGRSAAEVVAGLVRLGELKGLGFTLRQLSAAAFFGDSKFLERHGSALVDMLYPALMPAPRALVVDVFLPAHIKGVLFIENQDTYVHAAAGHLPAADGYALVFASGFKGGAARIREPGCAVLHYAGGMAAQERFERWWFNGESPAWPVYFWGDLDFEGMGILKQLRRVFGAGAWQPGYGRLLAWLSDGRGHLPQAAEKLLQKDPENTGCPYADEVLLPALRRWGCCVDQEAVTALPA